ncbi:MAG: hypothetical protein ACE5I7_08960 [Candidatus Binatia bacterium]
MTSLRCFPLLLTGLLAVVPAGRAAEHQHPAGDAHTLGQVAFSTSCTAEVREDFNRAVARLHSFWYQASEKAFAAVARKDPSCALAYWGIAMSRFHQLWGKPRPENVRVGQAALEKAKLVGAKSERERGYISALGQLYKDANKVDHLDRMVAYERAMEKLSRRYSDDSEAAIFYALALLGTAYASPPDRTYARQHKAGAILEKIFATQPHHPGVAHYIIHSYDYPPLAGRALRAARRYAKIAPQAPHALHMPSHIFTRLGLWQESIASNRAAAAAASFLRKKLRPLGSLSSCQATSLSLTTCLHSAPMVVCLRSRPGIVIPPDPARFGAYSRKPRQAPGRRRFPHGA